LATSFATAVIDSASDCVYTNKRCE